MELFDNPIKPRGDLVLEISTIDLIGSVQQFNTRTSTDALSDCTSQILSNCRTRSPGLTDQLRIWHSVIPSPIITLVRIILPLFCVLPYLLQYLPGYMELPYALLAMIGNSGRVGILVLWRASFGKAPTSKMWRSNAFVEKVGTTCEVFYSKASSYSDPM